MSVSNKIFKYNKFFTFIFSEIQVHHRKLHNDVAPVRILNKYSDAGPFLIIYILDTPFDLLKSSFLFKYKQVLKKILTVWDNSTRIWMMCRLLYKKLKDLVFCGNPIILSRKWSGYLLYLLSGDISYHEIWPLVS